MSWRQDLSGSQPTMASMRRDSCVAPLVFCVSLGFPGLVLLLRHLGDTACAEHVNPFMDQRLQFTLLVLVSLPDLRSQERQTESWLLPLCQIWLVDCCSLQGERAVIRVFESMQRIAFLDVATPPPFVLVVTQIVGRPILLENMHFKGIVGWVLAREHE